VEDKTSAKKGKKTALKILAEKFIEEGKSVKKIIGILGIKDGGDKKLIQRLHSSKTKKVDKVQNKTLSLLPTSDIENKGNFALVSNKKTCRKRHAPLKN
jgi:hypothetical protein